MNADVRHYDDELYMEIVSGVFSDYNAELGRDPTRQEIWDRWANDPHFSGSEEQFERVYRRLLDRIAYVDSPEGRKQLELESDQEWQELFDYRGLVEDPNGRIWEGWERKKQS